ncbi:TIGR02301 family protein [Parvibaculaceae bacterium PLY_AMNH_Bact1]|nr:TIGR02301 family protein [Parvibaculaceae bacterium PLY_AMNH_Bact1]
MMLDYVRNRQQRLVDLSQIGTKQLLRPAMGLAALLMVSLAFAGSANGEVRGETRSGASEGEMVRLAEILGAVHHLREVCNANEGQLWRSKMQDLLRHEKPVPDMKELMVARFNRAYHQHRLAYPRCTGQARADAARFLDEGSGLTQRLAARTRG